MRRKLLLITAVLAFSLFIVMPLAQANATAGTTGKLNPVISFYNPGTPYMLEIDNLQDGSYYALEIGSNLGSSYVTWDNFTASGTTHYTTFNVASGDFGTQNKLTVLLYGAINDSDTSATQLSQVDFSTLKTSDILSYQWFMDNIFLILIFLIFVTIVAGIIGYEKIYKNKQ